MVYNTGDGSALVVKDLATTPRSPPEYQVAPKHSSVSVPAGKEPSLTHNTSSLQQREKDQNKTLASGKAFRKSQHEFHGSASAKVSPQSKIRYPQNIQKKNKDE